jgi:hypothetical protein
MRQQYPVNIGVPRAPCEFNGTPTFKWLCYVLDRRDGKIKPFFMAHTIYKAIEGLQLKPEYAFEEVPMPFDIPINAKGAGTKEVVYTVMPARVNTPLTLAERALLTDTQPIRNLQKAIYETSGESGPADKSAPMPTEPPPPVTGDTTRHLPDATLGMGMRWIRCVREAFHSNLSGRPLQKESSRQEMWQAYRLDASRGCIVNR